MSKGFSFYENYWTSVQHLSEEEQKDVFYALINYAMTGEVVDKERHPLAYMMVMNNKVSIDNSLKRWEQNNERTTKKIESKSEQNKIIAKLIADGLNSREIEEVLAEEYECKLSNSAIRKTAPWKEKNDSDFREKWGLDTKPAQQF